jgi:hypothetical protein
LREQARIDQASGQARMPRGGEGEAGQVARPVGPVVIGPVAFMQGGQDPHGEAGMDPSSGIQAEGQRSIRRELVAVTRLAREIGGEVRPVIAPPRREGQVGVPVGPHRHPPAGLIGAIPVVEGIRPGGLVA